LIPTEQDIIAFDPEAYTRHASLDGSSPPALLPRAILTLLYQDARDEATPSHAEIILYVPSRADSSILIQRYLETVEGTHRLFHIPSLHRELTNFWSDQSSVGCDWLAYCFLILALGFQASGGDGIQKSLSTSGNTSASWLSRFIFAAQVCLEKAEYILTVKSQDHYNQSLSPYDPCHSDEWLLLPQL